MRLDNWEVQECKKKNMCFSIQAMAHARVDHQKSTADAFVYLQVTWILTKKRTNNDHHMIQQSFFIILFFKLSIPKHIYQFFLKNHHLLSRNEN